MLLHEAIYDLDELSRENLHIHTKFSRCALAEMELKSIIEVADTCSLRQIAITNHIHPGEHELFKGNDILRNELEGIEHKCSVLIGAELSAYAVGTYCDTPEENSRLDYRLYSYNHYNADLWTFPEDLTAIGFWNHAKAILTQLFADKRADCIAHPFMWKTIREHITDGGNEDGTYVTRIIPDNELGDLLELGFKSSVAWELNRNAIIRDPVFYKRMFNLGKEIGVVFNYATDAHTLSSVNTKEGIETIKSIMC